MIERLFPFIRLPISVEQFHQLPQNPAYKYEYLDGEAWLSARPKVYHAMLRLRPRSTPVSLAFNEKLRLRRIRPRDWASLPNVFAGAFHRVQPFASLESDARQDAAQKCLADCRAGHDGPVIRQASFVVERCEDHALVGAILITLMRSVDLTTFEPTRWKEPPPRDCLKQKLGRPHLTWIFVGPWSARNGIGTALLTAACGELLALGYRELASSFLLGNESSMLWHWRNGFRLLEYPGSMRRIRALSRTQKSSGVKNDDG